MAREVMINLGCFWGGKRIDPWLQKQMRFGKSTNVSHRPFVLIILHLNVEGQSANKICIISQLATRHRTLVILLQKTHCVNAHQLLIPHLTLAGWVSSMKHGLAMIVYEKLSWTLVDQSSERSPIEWLCLDIDGCKIVNIYKPPTFQFTLTTIPVLPYFCLYAGDLNCQHTDWGHNYTSPNGKCLADWAAKENLSLFYYPKMPKFLLWSLEHRNTGNNPNLAFANKDLNNSELDVH